MDLAQPCFAPGRGCRRRGERGFAAIDDVVLVGEHEALGVAHFVAHGHESERSAAAFLQRDVLDARDARHFGADSQRTHEIEAAAGAPQKALMALDRAANVESADASFWIRLGKLYATIIFKSESEPKPEEIKRVNVFFEKAVARAGDDSAALKEVADYFAASQQIQEAIPLYLKVLELQPDDVNAREKLATGFVLTNQREKAIQMLEEIIKKQPAKYQPYDLLAQLFDEGARALERANQPDQAKALFAKAAANYEQSLLINPTRANTYLRLAELLIVPAPTM